MLVSRNQMVSQSEVVLQSKLEKALGIRLKMFVFQKMHKGFVFQGVKVQKW